LTEIGSRPTRRRLRSCLLTGQGLIEWLVSTRADVGLRFFQQRYTGTARREIFFYLPIPFRRILLKEPASKRGPLLSAEFGNRLFDGFYGHIPNLELFQCPASVLNLSFLKASPRDRSPGSQLESCGTPDAARAVAVKRRKGTVSPSPRQRLSRWLWGFPASTITSG
jgi:hypothetical protein